VHSAAAKRLPERLGDVVLALDLGEASRAIPAVERKRSGRKARRRAVCARFASDVAWIQGVACHDLILAGIPPPGRQKDPPHTRQSPRTLAAFRPWGGWRDERRAGGLDVSLAAAAGAAAQDPAETVIRSKNAPNRPLSSTLTRSAGIA
jgi:hypothetical protein